MLGFYYSTDKIIRIMFTVPAIHLLVIFVNQSQLIQRAVVYPLSPPSVHSITQSPPRPAVGPNTIRLLSRI